MAKPEHVKVGDTIFILPTANVNARLKQRTAVVREKRGWGVWADIHMPDGDYSIRVQWDGFEVVY